MSAREPIWVEDLAQGDVSPRLQLAVAAGLQSVAAFPLRERETVLAVWSSLRAIAAPPTTGRCT